jgi:hypothetical protein
MSEVQAAGPPGGQEERFLTKRHPPVVIVDGRGAGEGARDPQGETSNGFHDHTVRWRGARTRAA